MTEEQEIEGVARMIRYYCKKKHGTDGKHPCEECEALIAYVAERRHKCPFGDNKPFCANCKIHCYKPDMREKIRAVMRYAAPRVTLLHPIMGFKHVAETLKTNRKNKKLDKQIRKEAEQLGVPFEELKMQRLKELKIQAVKEAKALQKAKEEEARAKETAKTDKVETEAKALDTTPKNVETAPKAVETTPCCDNVEKVNENQNK